MCTSSLKTKRAFWIAEFFLFASVALFAISSNSSSSQISSNDFGKDVLSLMNFQADAWNRGDLEGYMAGYWKSPELKFISDGTVTQGWEATLERYRKRYKADGKEMGKLRFSDIEVIYVSENLAFVTGRWALTFSKSPDKPAGGYTLVVMNMADGWRVVVDNTTSDKK
jgi:beta-aspartyl-peptidase (threonine type)